MRQEKILDKFWLQADSGAYTEVNIREMNYVQVTQTAWWAVMVTDPNLQVINCRKYGQQSLLVSQRLLQEFLSHYSVSITTLKIWWGHFVFNVM